MMDKESKIEYSMERVNRLVYIVDRQKELEDEVGEETKDGVIDVGQSDKRKRELQRLALDLVDLVDSYGKQGLVDGLLGDLEVIETYVRDKETFLKMYRASVDKVREELEKLSKEKGEDSL